MLVRKLLVSAAFVLAGQCVGTIGHAQDLTNWIRPYNFYTPNLNAGQYAFQAGVGLDGRASTSEYDGFQGPTRNKSTADNYSFATRFLYAVSDRWAVASSVNFIPGQSDEKITSTANPDYFVVQSSYQLKPSYNVGFTLTYKPTPVLELFGTAHYNRSKRELLPAIDATDYRNTSESYTIFVGFNTAR